jgi:hypothetical protein
MLPPAAATGVAVIGSRLGEVDHAMTVNAFTSMSVNPPLVLGRVGRAGGFPRAVVARGASAPLSDLVAGPCRRGGGTRARDESTSTR